MQPRLGLATALVDYQRIGLDHRAAQAIGGLGQVGEGASRLPGHDGVTVAAGDAGRHAGEHARRPLDGKGGNQAGDAAGDQPDHQAASHGGQHGNQAGGEHGQRYPDRWQDVAEPRRHQSPPCFAGTLAAKC